MPAPKPTSTPFIDTVSPPPRAASLSDWALLPLRLFLGVTFLYAGIQKFSNPHFFDAKDPSSIQAQFQGSVRVSPIGSLLAHFSGAALTIGIIIAVAEIAIGLGTLVGLLSRVAAIGGAILSFTLFLTVSFHSTPYFTGADIVFFFAWMPMIVAAPSMRLSLDGYIKRRATREFGAPDPSVVAVTFAQVQSVCGAYKKGACSARGDGKCVPHGCPFLDDVPNVTEEVGARVDRRTALLTATSAGIAAGTSILLAGAAVGAGQVAKNNAKGGTTHLTVGSTTTTPGATTTPGTSGLSLGPASSIKVNSSATFTIPSSGDPGLVIRTAENTFVGYDATCTHAGCPVNYSPGQNRIMCPCHGSQFDAATGQVLQGPATTGLTVLNIVEGANGDLYLQ